MYLPEKDRIIEDGMSMGADDIGYVGELYYASNGEEASPDRWTYRALIDFCYDGNDENKGRLAFEFYKGEEPMKIDGNAIGDVVLEFAQDGAEDESDIHYTYTSLTIHFESGDENKKDTRLLPSKTLIGAAKKVFRQIVRMADK